MVLFARPLTEAETPVIPVWLETVVAKVELVETRALYDVAPVDAVQDMVREVARPTAPLVGEASAGAPGAATIVVKFHTLDQALVPPASVAFARQ